ncbi:MAG: hypothetical protein ACOC1D_05620 [Prolixibacteraceae bacterium]
MNAAADIYFDGLLFLDELEKEFNSNGLDGIVQLTEKHLPIGRNINMTQKIEKEPRTIYKIERVTICKMNLQEDIKTFGNENADSVIRSLKLPYLEIPFQVNIYGSLVK